MESTGVGRPCFPTVPVGVNREALTNLKILVAEDEPELLRFYKVFLEDQGYEVVTARDGQECLDLYHIGLKMKSGFDLVILDHRMPKINGMDAAKKIAAVSPSQKFLMITAIADLLEPPDRLHNMQIMSKPFDVDELASTIRRLVR